MFFFLDVAVWWLIIWVVKNAAMDVVHACKGTANPRYELAKAKAKAAGQPSPTPHRYGSREWFADLLSDGLVAQTEWRRRRAVEKKRKPVDDMLDVVREFEGDRLSPSRRQQATTRAPLDQPAPAATPTPQPATEPAEDTRPIAPVIYLFPNTKEIVMANSEVTGLQTAIAFAEAAASAHQSFATAGSEGYTGALESFDVSGATVDLAREAQEASTTAAAKWTALDGALKQQLTVKEAYDANPDAGNQRFVQGE